ncbi:MAG: hypothetical protein ACKVWV_20250 [Planctomycetota bacterium]
MSTNTAAATRLPFTRSLRIVRWSLAIVLVATVAFTGLGVLDEACDTSSNPFLVLAGNYQGDWVLTEQSRTKHPEHASARERLRLRVTEPVQALDEAGYRKRMPAKPFDVARVVVAWNDVEAPCLVRVEASWPLPRVVYQSTEKPFGDVGYGSYFAIAMDSSLSPARERLYVGLGDDIHLSYARGDAPWYWRVID